MESNFKPRLLVAYFFLCIGSAFGVGVVVTQVVAVAAVWLLMLHIGYYLRSASLRCVYRRCRCRPPVSQPAACAYLAESGPRRGLSDGMMLTQNQFHWQYMDDAADAAAPLILLLSLYSVFFFFRSSVFFAAFFDGWLTKGRAQIVGLFVLFDSSTQTHNTHHCRCQIALISLSCQITGTAGSKCLTSLVTQLKRYSWATRRAPLDRQIATWLVYFAVERVGLESKPTRKKKTA